MKDTEKSFDEMRKISKTIHEAKMFIVASIMKMRRDTKNGGDLEGKLNNK